MSTKPGSGEMYCRSCGEIIKKEAEICPHCGVRNEGRKNTGETAQSARKAGGTGHDPSQFETTVSGNWYYAVSAGVILWILFFVIVPHGPSGVVGGIGIFSLLIGWILLPVAVYYDGKYIRANSRWNPNPVIWIIVMIIPGVNILAGAVYLYRRHEVIGIP